MLGCRALAIACLFHAGCALVHERPTDAALPDACTQQTTMVSRLDVDLLLMIDDSSSMQVHQVQLQSQLPRIVQTLVTGQRDAAHGGNFTPSRSLHIGVVSSSMGLGPITGIPSCPAGFGDDGILFTRSPMPATGCDPNGFDATYPHGVFAFAQGQTAPTAAQFTTDVACVAVLGEAGCGLEYELEPILKALAPAPDASGASSVTWTAPGYRPPVFWGHTFGHGADPATNGSFLRPDSALAILTLNDEDDQSTDHYEIWGTDPMYTGYQLNVRANQFSSLLFPVQRYVDGLIGLRTTPGLLIYSTITGLPNDLSPPPNTPTTPALLAQILADPRMVPTIDPAMTQHLLPACQDTLGHQSAVPGLRMIQVAQGLQQRGASVAVHSICENDFTPAIDELTDRIAQLTICR
jgi:hypothetical protein